ncbi:MAG TPA: DUF6531 domain-containing protein, partial [Polyangiaceae bacterium LLY-WYZ-14_1]|nr:DUF6531 domain-containing protein [Polyangiaceae bacterium LLY-WYZ-14_1]
MAAPVHIPIGGTFIKPPGNDSEQFMGSSTVICDGDAMGYNGLPVLSCQDVGMPAPPRPKKKKKSPSLFLPVSTATAIPAGPPVLVGGAPTISAVGLDSAGAMKAAGGLGKALKRSKAVKKAAEKADNVAKKVSDVVHDAAKKGMDKAGVKQTSKLRDRVHKGICTVTGHPVDVASGNMFDQVEDFRLGESSPLVWERTYDSVKADTTGPLGRGWTHNHDAWLIRNDVTLDVRLPDGRDVVFQGRLAVGSEIRKEEDALTARRPTVDRFEVEDRDKTVLVFEKGKTQPNLFVLTEQIYRGGRTIRYRYDDGGRLRRIVDGGRTLDLVWTKGRLTGVRGPSVLQPKPAEGHGPWLVRYQYDEQGRLAEVRTQGSVLQSYRYAGRTGLLTEETRRNGLRFYFEYDGTDSAARCTRTWGDGGIFDHRLVYRDGVTEVTDSLGHTRIYEHEGGLVTREVDPTGAAKQTMRDDARRVTEEIDALGGKTTYTYDERGNPTCIERPDGSQIRVAYGHHDLPEEIITPGGREYRFRYTAAGQLESEV